MLYLNALCFDDYSEECVIPVGLEAPIMLPIANKNPHFINC